MDIQIDSASLIKLTDQVKHVDNSKDRQTVNISKIKKAPFLLEKKRQTN